MNKKHILVTGATGQQGGSVISALLNKGHQISGLTEIWIQSNIHIAGDELSGAAYADKIAAASARPINYFEIPIEDVRKFSEDLALMYEWFNSTGYRVDIDRLKREYHEIEWETFSQWANRQDWNVLTVPE